ncbi:alpha/beta hydrolase [Kibdelosporangium lantanae]|uniref:Alpha/beta hydrolase n=1 Tax=Kibdelosporangium lantanae TaxID=1497396 RepID=A0ABW3ME64_9PSEU
MNPVTSRKFLSKARGQEVTAITMAPEGHDPNTLPKCVALHGRGGDANWMVNLGVPKFLTDAVRSGVPPFAVISVDGGRDSYWTAKGSDDPQRMLAEELGPVQAAFGISMGAFGSLVFARRRGDLKAVAVASPALFKTWGDASSRHVFASQAVWEDNEPLRHTREIANTPLGVWCGSKDPFINVAQTLIAQAKPARAAISPGAHDEGYWKRVLPEMIAFVGERLK